MYNTRPSFKIDLKRGTSCLAEKPMSFYQNWKSPEPSYVIDVLETINQLDVMPPLGVFSAVLRCQPLSFYEEGMLFEAVYTRVSPNLRQYFMVGDESIVPLNGTKACIERANGLFSFWLDATNVLDYVAFVLRFGMPQGHTNRLVVSLDDVTSDMLKQNPDLSARIIKPEPKKADGDAYRMAVSFWDGSKLQQTELVISFEGQIICNGPDLFTPVE